jgi:Transposase DDE domain group 1
MTQHLRAGRHFLGARYSYSPAVEVSADGVGVVSHVGARLLADLADRTTLTGQLSGVFAARMVPQTAHDPGRVLVDVAMMIADGGECISDIATLADQGEVFGPVASDSTCWRVLDAISADDLAGIAAARAAAREVAWAQRAEATGAALPASLVAGAPLLDRDGRPVLVIDQDATIVIAHSEKESAAATFALLRLPPGAGVLRQQQRSAGRAAAPGQCRVEHRR